MEAIAHSPSFAKKAGVPQSVGKDFAAADKGKTFKRGGDMKEAMVGKEVAFMKKKGAPKSMIKHEMSEMKGMKAGGRVRRMAAGGTGDPFELSDTDRENYAKNGAENLKRFKGFFGFGDKEEAAPIDRSRDVVSKPTESATYTPRPPLGITKPSNQSPRTRRENEDTSYSDSIERDDAAAMDKTAKGPQYISSINTSGGEYSGDGISSLKPSPTRRPVTVSKTREKTSVTAAPAKSKVPAKIDSEKLLKDAEEDVLRKKPTAMTEQMRKAPTINDLYRGQKSMGEEIGDVLKSFRESIRGGLQKGKERQESKGSTMYAKGGNVKRMRYGGEPDSSMDMGQPMRGAAPMNPAMQAPMNPAMQAPMKPAMQTPKASPRVPLLNPNRPGLSDLAKQKMGEYNQGMLGRIAASKKMAEGGVARADGIAKKGKTEGKMVKMAGGGFVKSADGCAQRGKTKAFQVKMKRGGMC
jgi:hypothetical protein